MKALLFTILLFGAPIETQQSASVYICTGPTSECYHCRSNCRGLNSCSGDIVQISLEKAKQMGRRACGWCYR